MSELIDTDNKANGLRQRLLATVSAFSLLGIVLGANAARAMDGSADNPTVWIELGGQLERVDGGIERYSPPFFSQFDPKQLVSPLDLERPSRYGNGGEGTITFEPEDSSWIVLASIRYGRTQSKRHLHEEYQVLTKTKIVGYNKYLPGFPNFEETATSDHESHMIADFQAGKDVGLGLWGREGLSTISFGVRVAQFHASDASSVTARPQLDYRTLPFPPNTLFVENPHNYYASAASTRNFHGIGPSLEWKNSTPLIGNLHDGGISFDWGINGAVLFGRQKMAAHHQTRAHYSQPPTPSYHSYQRSAQPVRARSVAVPNAGAFAGLTYRVDDFKLALGYRGDFFFGAMDGGWDVRKSTDRGFYGPFLNVSVGLGG